MRFQTLMCVLIIGATACGGDSVEIDDLPDRLAEAFCKYAVECQQAPGKSACLSSLQLHNKYFETLVLKVKAGVIKYDPDQGGECLDALASQGCAFAGLRGDDACATLFTGTVAAGGACTISPECANQGTCNRTDPNCDPDVACCAGTCEAGQPTVALGADCTNAQCDRNSYCPSTTNRCTALIATAGASCDEFDACANPMICDVFATAPTCVVPAGRNATCDPMAFIACADNRDYCDATTRKCTQNVAIGQPCEGANGAECIGYARCANMTCEAQALAGATCTMDLNACLGDLECTNGTCTLAPAQTGCPRTQPEPTAPDQPTTQALPATARRAPRDRRATPEWMPTL